MAFSSTTSADPREIRSPPAAARRSKLFRFVERHALAAVLAVALVMCFAGTFQHGLWTPDEPREAEIGREMMLSGPSVMPMLDGEPFLEKPPLFPWIMALGYRVFGVHPGVARLPSVLFSVGSLLVAFALGRRAGGRWAGVASAIVLATTVKFAEISHCAVNDAALTFFVASGHLGFLVARDRERRGEKSLGLVLAGVAAALAFLTKSFIGPALVAGPPLVAAAMMREWRFLRFAFPRAALWCTLFVVAIGAPWVVALANAGGWSAVRVCLVDNTLGRSLHAAPEFGHANGPLYYLGVFPVESLPWVIALPAAIASGVLARDRRGGKTKYLACIVVAGLVMLSLPSTKRGLYALPLYPAAAVVAGVWLSRVGSNRERRIDRITLASLLALMAIMLLVAAGCAAWIEYGGGAPEKLASSVAFLREHYAITSDGAPSGSRGSFALITAAVAGGTGLAIAWFALRAWHRSIASLARACAYSALAMFLVWLCVVQPFIDPLKNMSDGARRSMGEVPASEPLLGLALDETTRAIVPYYSGRFIRNVARPEEALDALRSGPSKHLVVMDNAEHDIDAELRAHLSAPDRKRLDAGRALNVYSYVP
jgi:4-amino-4-deoxy-L-arabinose transferase-like glycosyltransferase